MTEPTLVVMAAGMGSRYGGCKQIEPLGPGGEPTIAYSVYDAIRAGFSRVVFVIRREMQDDFHAVIGRHVSKCVDTAYSFQELTTALPEAFAGAASARQKPWGTGHAVLCCRDSVQTPFAVINADDFYGRHTFEVLAGHLRTAADCNGVGDYSMIGFILENTLSEYGQVSRGVCEVSEDGFLTSVTERTKIGRDADGHVRYETDGCKVEVDPRSIVSMNTWGFTPGMFAHLATGFEKFLAARGDDPKSEYYLPGEVADLIDSGAARVKVLHTDSTWFGLTYPEDRPPARAAIAALVESGEYPPRLWDRDA